MMCVCVCVCTIPSHTHKPTQSTPACATCHTDAILSSSFLSSPSPYDHMLVPYYEKYCDAMGLFGGDDGNEAPSPSPSPSPSSGHVVRAGDTLWSLASSCGVTVDALLSWNPGERSAVP